MFLFCFFLSFFLFFFFKEESKEFGVGVGWGWGLLEASIFKNFSPKKTPLENKLKNPSNGKTPNKQTKKQQKSVTYIKGPFGNGQGVGFSWSST